MSPAAFVILSGILTYGAPLAFALRELAVLRRTPDGPEWRPDPKPEPAPTPKPLPPCLLVAFQPVKPVDESPRVRVLETV